MGKEEVGIWTPGKRLPDFWNCGGRFFRGRTRHRKCRSQLAADANYLLIYYLKPHGTYLLVGIDLSGQTRGWDNVSSPNSAHFLQRSNPTPSITGIKRQTEKCKASFFISYVLF